MQPEVITNFLRDYGWQVALIALAGIVIVGFLKMVKAFNWIKIYTKNENGEKVVNEKSTKNVKKFIYYILNIIIAVGACTLYVHFTSGISGVEYWAIMATSIIAYSTTIYAVYENLGIRTLWQLVLRGVSTCVLKIGVAVKSGKKDKVVDIVEDTGKQLVEGVHKQVTTNLPDTISIKEPVVKKVRINQEADFTLHKGE